MLIDALGIEGSSALSGDVCIVGAGPAGLAVAVELESLGADVVLLEAGGLPYDRDARRNWPKAARDHLLGAQSLTRGHARGEPYFPLRMSRARGIGGSANALKEHGLRSRPLDRVDFGSRLGVDWPISHEQMAAHLPGAERLCGLDGADLRWDPLLNEIGLGDGIDLVDFRHGDRLAFPSLVNRLGKSPGIQCVTGAAVVGFDVTAEGRVQRAVVNAVGSHHTLTVEASLFVVAGGGLDNARILLASTELHGAMGAATDSTGRYFMEHLHFVAGHILPSSGEAHRRLGDMFGPPHEGQQWLALPEGVVEARKLLRTAAFGVPVYKESLDRGVRSARALARAFPYGPFNAGRRFRQLGAAVRSTPRIASAALARISGSRQPDAFALPVMAEQMPDRESRVTLSSKTDRTGLRLPILTWKVSDRDLADVRLTIEAIGEELDRIGIGRVISVWESSGERPIIVGGGWHHIGTTRMSTTAETGVVDSDAKVHGVENLYVAGSSVFPTGGMANPTLTLVALAVRLGQYLGKITH